jgi:hypothetical protein
MRLQRPRRHPSPRAGGLDRDAYGQHNPKGPICMTDRETVVVRDGDSGSSMSVILGIIAILVVVAAIWFFAMGPGAGSRSNDNTNNGPNINVEVPSAPAGS